MFFWRPSQAAALLPGLFDRIAEEFSGTRSAPWSELRELFQKTPKGATVLDAGCGNGRIVPLLREKKCTISGVDISKNLLDIARRKYPGVEFRDGDLRHIPFPKNMYDEVWCIASFHHLPTQRDRIMALLEMRRVLKRKGEIVMTVWDLWHAKKYSSERRNALIRSIFLPFWAKRDLLISWGKEKIPRYYHAFSREELLKLARKTGFSVVEYKRMGNSGQAGGEDRNIMLRLRKEKFS